MSAEKIDLAALAKEADARKYTTWLAITPPQAVAIVGALRVARDVIDQYEMGEVDHRALKRLSAALAPFTDSSDSSDSAEVRSDG